MYGTTERQDLVDWLMLLPLALVSSVLVDLWPMSWVGTLSLVRSPDINEISDVVLTSGVSIDLSMKSPGKLWPARSMPILLVVGSLGLLQMRPFVDS
jgi:hypothetical protein